MSKRKGTAQECEETDSVACKKLALAGSKINLIHFTNGLSNFGTGGDGLRQIVESPKWKKLNPIQPSESLVFFFAQSKKQRKISYFDKAYKACCIMAHQLGYELSEYLAFRNWVTERQRNRKDKAPRVTYRKLEDVLVDVAGQKGSSNYKNMMSTLSNLEASTQDVSESYSNLSSQKDHPQELGQFPTKTGFGAQLVDNAESMHLCWVVTERIFSPILYQDKTYSTDFSTRIKLMCKIFGECKKKNALVEMLRDVVTVLGSPSLMIQEHQWVYTLLEDDPRQLMNRISIVHGSRFSHGDFSDEVNHQFQHQYAQTLDLRTSSSSEEEKRQSAQLDFFYGKGNGKNQIDTWRHFIAIKKRIVDKYKQIEKKTRDNEKRTRKLPNGSKTELKNCATQPLFGNENSDKLTTKQQDSRFTDSTGGDPQQDHSKKKRKKSVMSLGSVLRRKLSPKETFAVAPSVTNNTTASPTAIMSPAIRQQTTRPVVDEENMQLDEYRVILGKESPASASASANSSNIEEAMKARFASYAIAANGEVQCYSPCLVVKESYRTVILWNAAEEFYIMPNLSKNNHCWDYSGGPDQSCATPHPSMGNQPQLVIPQGCKDYQSRQDPCMVIARPSSHLWKKHFDHLGVDLGALLIFVTTCGKVDLSRDTDDAIKCRIDFGCAGLDGTMVNGRYRPASLCHSNIFDNLDENQKETVKQSIANIMDSMQLCADMAFTENGIPLSFNNSRREKDFAACLREFVGADVSRGEHVSLIAKCLGKSTFYDNKKKKNITPMHKDSMNCQDANHDYVFCMGVYVVDAMGDLWNLKCLVTSRRRVGEYYKAATKRIQQLVSDVERVLQYRRDAYQQYHTAYNGLYPLSCPPTPVSFDDIVLDENCPYEEYVIFKGEDEKPPIKMMMLKLPTAINRVGPWLWGPASAIVSLIEIIDKDDEVVDLFLIAGLQNSWMRFHYVCQQMISEYSTEKQEASGTKRTSGIFNSYAGEKYTQIALDTFNSLVGGPAPRFQCCNWKKVKEHLFDGTVQSGGNLTSARDSLLKLFDAINDLPDMATPQDIKEVVSVVRSKFNGCCELGEFKLMVLLQLAALTGFRLNARPLLNNLSYPAEGTASYQNLVTDRHFEINDFESVSRTICEETGIKPYNRNVGETLLCESIPGRREKQWDLIPKGCDALKLDSKTGQCLIRKYGKYTWHPL